MNKLSLLFKLPESSLSGDIDPVTESAIYDLSIDRATEYVIPDVTKRKYFLYVLSHPLLIRENIIYRQELYSDFYNIPLLFEKLSAELLRINEQAREFESTRASMFSLKRLNNSTAAISSAASSLEMTAIYVTHTFDSIKSLSSLLMNFDIKSEGLLSIRSFLNRFCDSEAFSEIYRLSHNFADIDAKNMFDLYLKFDNSLLMTSCELFSFGISSEKAEQHSIIKLLSRKKEHVSSSSVKIETDDVNIRISLLKNAFAEIEQLFAVILNELNSMFTTAVKELDFYESALSFGNCLPAVGVPCVIPDILPESENTIKCVTLYDLYLSVSSVSVSAVVPNDVSFGPATKGVLIKGKNNSGKTVFLRSIGTAQLFAQAGLPVCAESASISIRRGLYTHFAAAEKELNGYQSAGRFEQEVSDIADIVRKAESCSLVLMNETFQTTSYSEGAEGIFNILKYFEEMNITWVFVSHLNDIFKMFSCDGSRIMLLGTSESTKYKLDSIIY